MAALGVMLQQPTPWHGPGSEIHLNCTISMEWLMLNLESRSKFELLAMGFLHTIEPGVDLQCIKKQWRQ